MQESVMQRMWNSAYLSGGNAAYVEELYELYLHVQHHQVFTTGIDLEFLHERRGVLIRVVTINADLQHGGHP